MVEDGDVRTATQDKGIIVHLFLPFLCCSLHLLPSRYTTGDDTDTVNGIDIGTCLGDLFSIRWMEDSDEFTAIAKQTPQ